MGYRRRSGFRCDNICIRFGLGPVGSCGRSCHWKGKPDPWEEVVEAPRLDVQGEQSRKRKDWVRTMQSIRAWHVQA